MLLIINNAAVPRAGNGPPREFVIFMVFWVLLGIISFLFFQFNRNAALKLSIWPIFVVMIGIIFGGFLFYMLGRQQPQVLYFAIPAIIIISFLNIRRIRFCDSCGKTLHRQPIFSRTQFCPYCGAKLNADSAV